MNSSGWESGGDRLKRLSDAIVAEFERALQALNSLNARDESMTAYLSGHITTDSRDDEAQARFSELQQRGVALEKLETRFTAWLGRLPVDELIERSAAGAAHAFPFGNYGKRRRPSDVGRGRVAGARAGTLRRDGLVATARKRDVSNYRDIEIDGRLHSLPISAIRNLAMNPNRDLRRRAWGTELEAWDRHGLPLAAALNGVKGEVLTIGKRRSWQDPLDDAIFNNNIDREILTR